MLDYITPGSVLVGVISLIILYISEKKFYTQNKFLSFVPGALLAVIFGVIINVIFSDQNTLFKINPDHLVNLPLITNYTELKNVLISPDFSMVALPKFWIIVVTIAIVASLESLLSIEATDKMDPKKRNSNTNKELIAQGVGNMTCGFLGALPVTAVIVRSSANINGGAKTKLSAVIHAILLLVCVLFIPNILSLIPNASLAAILVMMVSLIYNRS